MNYSAKVIESIVASTYSSYITNFLFRDYMISLQTPAFYKT